MLETCANMESLSPSVKVSSKLHKENLLNISVWLLLELLDNVEIMFEDLC